LVHIRKNVHWVVAGFVVRVCAALLICVFCLAFPAYAPEAQDRVSGESQPAGENLTSLAARQEALAAHLKAARDYENAKEFLKAARELNKAGHLQLQVYEPAEALLTFQQNLKLADKIKDAVARVDALNGIAAAYLHNGQYKNATPALEQSVAIAEPNGYREGHAEALLLLSDAKNYTNHEEALQIAPQALALWQSIGDKRGIIRSHLMIATFYLAQNSLVQATQSNQTALDLADQNNFKDLKAEALINLGFVDYRLGAWQRLMQRMVDAEELINAEAEPVRMTQIATSIAEAYIESGLPEVGVTKYQQALKIIQTAHRARDETVVLWGVGRALYFAKRYEEALPILEEAFAESKKQDQPIALSMCHDFIGRTLDGLNDHAGALKHLEKALELYDTAKNPMEVARTRARIGQIYEMSGRLDDARRFYQQSMQTFERLSDRVNQSATVFALGRLEMKSGNYDLAEQYLRQSIDATENMRRLSRSRDLTAGFSATVHDRYEQYIQCLMHNASDQSRVVLAFETSELARARSLAELLRVNDTNLLSNVNAELGERERALRQSLRVKEDERVSLLATEYTTAQLAALDAEMGKLTAEYNDVLTAINQRYPAYTQITQPQPWDLKRIQQEVIGDEDTVLLEYFLGDEKSHVWVVTRNSITSHELPSQAVIAKTVRSLFALLKQPANAETNDQLNATARELAQMILWPVAGELNKKRILVAADDALHYIPFQVLPADATNAEPLLARYEIVNVPSASILGELRKETARRPVRAKTLAAFGNPIFATDHTDLSRGQEGRLFYSAREIENLRDVASEQQTFAATEYDATREQLLKTDLTQFAILHFATHGKFDPERPQNSGLQLSTIDRDGKTVNGFVGLQDVYSLRAPVDLVVLSACETGLGEEVRGEGLLGLTRGFMYAGGTSVVASLWQVEDEVTAELMKRFYTELLNNHKPPAEALRAAQNAIRQVPEWSAPHYWAGFTLQGEYRDPVNASRGWPWYWAALMVGGVVSLTAGLLYRWRRSV
jgi:CHAT domain-containing protein